MVEEQKKIEDYRKEMIALQRSMSASERLYERAKHVIDTYGRTRIVRPPTGETNTGTDSTIEHVQRATFIKPCPAKDCKGFLSSAWKCGLCHSWTCPDCHEWKGLLRDIEHTCDPEKLATAQLLDKEAKSCPKCGVPICKIEGCDQMWCTVCNTGFSWRTGKIADGPVHNPHYFEYLRRQGLTPTGQVGQGIQGGHTCDGDLDRQVVRALGGPAIYSRRLTESSYTDQYLGEAWRLMREEQDPMQHREEASAETFRQMRVRYLVGELSEADWKVSLQRAEKDAHFQRAKQQVRDVFVNVSRDLIRQILDTNVLKEDIQTQIGELLAYCNTSYKAISERFNRKAPVYKIAIKMPKVNEIRHTMDAQEIPKPIAISTTPSAPRAAKAKKTARCTRLRR
jgi:hypothetical protein